MTGHPEDATSVKRVQEWFEVGARVGVLLAALAYICGMLIVLKYQATFGIFDMDVLRPRVVAAGMLFLTMLALSVVTVVPHISWPGKKKGTEQPASVHRRLARWLIDTGFYLGSAAFVAFVLAGMFVDVPVNARSQSAWIFIGAVFAQMAVTVFCLLAERTWPQLAWLFALAACGAIGGVIYAAVRTWPSADLRLAAWIVTNGVLVASLRTIGDGASWRSWPYPMAVLVASGVIAGYAAGVYGNISASWGGGRPRPVTVFLRAAQPYIDGTELHVLLIDETSSGYYITQSREDTSALFLPRDQILAVRYSRQSPDVQRADDTERDEPEPTPQQNPTQGTPSEPHDASPRASQK
jgi:hypothetical protein